MRRRRGFANGGDAAKPRKQAEGMRDSAQSGDAAMHRNNEAAVMRQEPHHGGGAAIGRKERRCGEAPQTMAAMRLDAAKSCEAPRRRIMAEGRRGRAPNMAALRRGRPL